MKMHVQGTGYLRPMQSLNKFISSYHEHEVQTSINQSQNKSLISSRKHVCVMYPPLNPTFTCIYMYIAKLGYAGVYFFHIFAPKLRFWVLELERQSMIWSKNMKILQKMCNLYYFRKSCILHGCIFVMCHGKINQTFP